MSWRPLDGVRVLDLSRLLPGPFMTQLLAELGAAVVKIEEPETGDYARWISPDVDGAGHAFSATNRGKRSIALNLKSAAARDVVLRLARDADVFVESFRPGVLDRLGLGDAALAAANPRLVRLSLVGYGEGPLRDDAGHDINYAALAGILDIQGDAGRPTLPGVQLADVTGALYGAVGVLAALHEREGTGRGRRIEVALSDAALALNAVHLLRAAADEPTPGRGEWELSGALACYRLYECADERWVALGALEGKFWGRFCEAAGRPEWAESHLARDAPFHAQVEALFASRAADEWEKLLRAAGVPVTPVLSPADALAHPTARRFAGRVGPGAPLTQAPSDAPVPALGADTERILRDAGYAREDIEALRAAGVIPQAF